MRSFDLRDHSHAPYRVRTTFPVDLQTRPFHCELTIGLGRCGQPSPGVVSLHRTLGEAGYVCPRTATVRWIANGSATSLPRGHEADLPLAVALLAAGGHVPRAALLSLVVVPSRIALDGAVLPTRGVLAIAQFAARRGYRAVMVPHANADEARLVGDVRVLPLSSVCEIVSALADIVPHGDARRPAPILLSASRREAATLPAGLHRAYAAAVVGGLSVAVCGAATTEDASLAEQLAAFLPAPSLEDEWTIAVLHSLADCPRPSGRPVRLVDHRMPASALLGTSQRLMPGELSVAHGGVCCVRDLDAFDLRRLLAIQRAQAVGEVSFIVGGQRVSYPARPQLLATAREHQVDSRLEQMHAQRLALFDLVVDRLQAALISSSIPHAQIAAAIARRTSHHIGATAPGTRAVHALLRQWRVASRHYPRLLRIAKTLRDLDGDERLTRRHIEEALQLCPSTRAREPDACAIPTAAAIIGFSY